MTLYELVKQNEGVLKRLARSGFAVEEIANLEIYEEYKRLIGEGNKVLYVVAHLAEVYRRSERTIQRIARKFSQKI